MSEELVLALLSGAVVMLTLVCVCRGRLELEVESDVGLQLDVQRADEVVRK